MYWLYFYNLFINFYYTYLFFYLYPIIVLIVFYVYIMDFLSEINIKHNNICKIINRKYPTYLETAGLRVSII